MCPAWRYPLRCAVSSVVALSVLVSVVVVTIFLGRSDMDGSMGVKCIGSLGYNVGDKSYIRISSSVVVLFVSFLCASVFVVVIVDDDDDDGDDDIIVGPMSYSIKRTMPPIIRDIITKGLLLLCRFARRSRS